MEQHSGNLPSILLGGGSLFLNLMSLIDKSTITFILGTTVSVLAIIHYTIQIRNNTKKKT